MYPNYAKMQTLLNITGPAEDNYTMTEDGWIIARVSSESSSTQPFLRVFINYAVVFDEYTQSAAYDYLWSPLFHVKKGDLVQYNFSRSDVANFTLRFLPSR